MKLNLHNERNKKMFYATITFVLSLSVLSIITFGAILPLTIPTSGTYDTTMNIIVDPINIDWGAPIIGAPVTRTATLTNSGGTNVISLQFTTNTLVGLTPSDFSFSCDLEGDSLTVGTTKTATFTLTLINPVSPAFSFNIVVNE